MRLEQMLNRLQAASLVHPLIEAEPAFLFNHVLIQETAYTSVLVKGRRQYHLMVAEAYERAYADRLDEYSPTLAYHYWRGEDWPRAAQHARRAGERATRVYALREAMGYYAQALLALDQVPGASDETKCDVILEWAEVAFAFEPYAKQLERLVPAEQMARQLQDKRRLALVLHTIGKVHVAAGHPIEAEAPLTECFALATELGDDRLAVIPMYYMGIVTSDAAPRRAVSYFNRAVELARRYGDVDIEAYALSTKAMVEARLGEVGPCRQSMEQALQIVDKVKSPMTDLDVYLYAAWSHLDLGEIPQALEYAKIGVNKAISVDNMECACYGFACLGFGHLRAEQIPEAVRAFEEAIRRSKISGAEEAEILGASGLGMARLLTGDALAVQALEDTLARARSAGIEYVSALLAQTLGEIYLERGALEQAAAHLNAALDYYRRNLMRPYLGRTLELLAQVAERQGDPDQANRVRAERAEMLKGQPQPDSAAELAHAAS